MDNLEAWRIAAGKTLKAERAAAGLSVRQLAERLGWGTASITRYEKGERAISLDQLVEISEIFGITPVSLMQKIEERLSRIRNSQTSNVVQMPDRFVIDDTVQAAFDAPKPSDYENGEEDYSQDPDDYRK